MKSYNFNKTTHSRAGDKLQFYASTPANGEIQTSYLCIERVTETVLSVSGIDIH